MEHESVDDATHLPHPQGSRVFFPGVKMALYTSVCWRATSLMVKAIDRRRHASRTLRSLLFTSTCRMLSLSAISVGSLISPTPGTITSRASPASVETTGTPQASASFRTVGLASEWEHKTTVSAALKTSAISDGGRKPSHLHLSPSDRARYRIPGRSLPSPTSTSSAFGTRLWTCMNDSRSRFRFLMGSILPANITIESFSARLYRALAEDRDFGWNSSGSTPLPVNRAFARSHC